MSRLGATTALADPELMTWDSEWWGVQVAKATHPDVDRWAAENTVGLMWLLVPSDRPEEAQEAEARGWRFMDVRVEFERWTEPRTGGWYPIRSADVDDLSALVKIARSSHRITRFYADPSLDDDRCDDLYGAWITSSLNGWARTVLVIGEDPLGYVTVHEESGVASIGLIAVRADSRNEGVGRQLVLGALGYAHMIGCSQMTVVTQGRNVAAQRLFQKCGFRTESTALWFHKRLA